MMASIITVLLCLCTLLLLSILGDSHSSSHGSSHGTALKEQQQYRRLMYQLNQLFIPSSPSSSLLLPSLLLLSTTSPNNHTTTINDKNSSRVGSINDDNDEISDEMMRYYATLSQLLDRYKGKLVHCCIPQYPHCDIFLCGTLHIAKTSTEMVRDVIKEIRPNYVVLELCDARLDNLIEQEPINITLFQVLKESIANKSFKTLGMGLLIWMQVKAANTMGNKLGGELSMGAKEGALQKSVLVLGDRQYSVTIQRVFDRLSVWDKVRMAFILIWEVFTMSIFKLKDYISKTENDENFIDGEIQKFQKYLPEFADIIINERDEYIAQTICEIARVGFNKNIAVGSQNIGKVVVVVGAGHLKGLQKWLSVGGINETRLNQISQSSKHRSCWPGAGMLSVFQYPASQT